MGYASRDLVNEADGAPKFSFDVKLAALTAMTAGEKEFAADGVDYTSTRTEIIVKADNASRPDVIPINHVLFGVYGGMYRPVWLIVTEPYNICVTDCASSGVYITQKNVSKKQADVKSESEVG